MSKYLEPSCTGLKSTPRAVARKLSRILTAMHELDGPASGELVNELLELRYQIHKRLKSEGWRIEPHGQDGWKVHPPVKSKSKPVAPEDNGPIRFRVRLPSGDIVTGPIHGSGGHIGNACSHLPREERAQAALRQIQAYQRAASRGLTIPVYQPVKGCFKLMPDWTWESDGRIVHASIVDSVIEGAS
jgi:hypothetical protein